MELLTKSGFDAVDYSMFIYNEENGIFNTPEYLIPDATEFMAKSACKTVEKYKRLTLLG